MWFKTACAREAGVSRRTLTDAHWQRIEALVPGKAGDRGATGKDKRRFVDAVLWLARPASGVRRLEHGRAAVRPLVESRRVGASVRGARR